MSVVALEPVVISGVTALDPTVISQVYALAPITLSAALGQAGLWTGEGPPTVVVGAQVGDEYIDTLTGTLYRLNPGL